MDIVIIKSSLITQAELDALSDEQREELMQLAQAGANAVALRAKLDEWRKA